MVAAMAGFAVEDMFLKSAARSIPLGEVLIIFGALGMLAFATLVKWRGENVFHPAILSRPILIRAVFEVTGRLFYTLAITVTALSSASAILQSAPLMVVAGAALIFGETVSLKRWAVICVGFIGVLIILRPGAEGFTALSLLALIGTIGFVGRDLATRAAPPVLSNMQLGVYGFAALMPTGLVLLAFTGGGHIPAALPMAKVALAALVGVWAYYCLTVAMRTGEVAVVTPFRYTRLVFALILGVTVFQERPDALTLIGSAIVVTAGIYTLLGSRKKAGTPEKTQ